MKKLVVICCAIGMCGSGFSQGLVNFRNTTSTLVSVDGSIIPAGPPALFCFGLFIAPPGTTNPVAFTYTGVFATNWITPGLIDGGQDRAIPGWAAGESKSYLIREWSADGMGTSTIDPTWFTNCLTDSHSPIATGVAGGGPVPILHLFGGGGLPGFNLIGGGAPPVQDTPEFQNLDFEMNCTRGPWTFDGLLPFWTGYAGTNQVSWVSYNGVCVGAPCISLHGSDDPWSLPGGVIRHGSFYVDLRAGILGPPWGHFATSIAQSGIVPTNARSLLLDYLGTVEVTFNGTPIPMRTLSSGGGYVLSGNVSQYAGQFGELRFTAPTILLPEWIHDDTYAALDYIRFSTSPAVGSPEVVTQPSGQTAEVGSQVRLSVRASGELPLAYDWIFNGTNLHSGATNSILELTNIEASQAGSYTVVVTNVIGAVTSAPAMLSVIAPVERRLVPGVTLLGEVGSYLTLDYTTNLGTGFSWLPMDSVSLASTSQLYFDLSTPLPPQRFYRAWQTNMPPSPPTLGLTTIPALTLTGGPGNHLHVDGINQFGPTDAWFTLDSVTLTNTSQLYFDVTASGQPARLYRLVPIP